MADSLLRSLNNLTGLIANVTTVLTAPTANFDKCVVTNVGVCNKSGVQDAIYLQLVPLTGATVYLVFGQPVFANDAWWSKPDMNLHLAAGDQLKAWSANAGQNLDVTVNYLFSDIL